MWAHNTACTPEDWAKMVAEAGEPHAGRNPNLVRETRTPQSYGLSTVADNPQQARAFQVVLAKLMDSTHPKGNAVQRYMRAMESGEPITQAMLRDVAANLQLNMKRYMQSNGQLKAGETIELHHWNYSKDAFPLQVADPRNLVMIKGTRQQNAALHDTIHRETSMSIIPDAGPTAPQHQLSLPGAAPGLDYLNGLIEAGRVRHPRIIFNGSMYSSPIALPD